MISGQDLSYSYRVTQCNFCTAYTQHPTILSCQHNLCKPCLDKQHRSEEAITDIWCPVCKSVPTSDSNKKCDANDNVTKNNHTEKMADRKLTLKCMQCERSEADLVCIECQLELCSNCIVGHLRIPTCRHHQIIHIRDKNLDGNTFINTTKFCLKHPLNPIKYNCVPCKSTVCVECKVEEHDMHQTESVQQALEIMLNKTNTHIPKIKRNKAKTEEILNKLRKIKEQCLSKSDATKQEIEEHFEKIFGFLKSEFIQLSGSVEVEYQATVKKLSLIESDLENELQNQQQLLTWSNKISQKTEAAGLLDELQNGVYEKMENCAEIHPSTDIEELQVPEIEFTANNIESSELKVGEVQINSRNVSIQPLERFRTTGVDFSSITNKHFNPGQSLKLNRKCMRICYLGGEFWCPCFTKGKGSIDVYSTEGVLTTTIQYDQIKRLWSVHPVNQYQLVGAAENGLFIMRKDGTVTSRLLQGKFCDVHANKETIVALEKVKGKHDKVHIWENEDPPNARNHFLLDNDNGENVVITDDHQIYASYWKYMQQSCIVRYSLTGDPLRQYGKYGAHTPGELDLPWLGSFDQEGSLLISDFVNKRLQVLDTKGYWSVLKHWTTQLRPVDVVFTSDSVIWVLCYDEAEETYYLKKYTF